MRPAGRATATVPLEAAAALCTEFPLPLSRARASISPTIGGMPWDVGSTSSAWRLVRARSILLNGVA